METSVTLQAPLHFPVWLLVLGLSLLAAGVAAIAWWWRGQHAAEDPVSDAPRPTLRVGEENVYLQGLDDLEARVRDGRIGMREAYNELSLISRKFARAADGRDFMVMNLSDIRKAGVPALEHVIERCYSPEFAERTDADAIADIEAAREMIRSWR